MRRPLLRHLHRIGLVAVLFVASLFVPSTDRAQNPVEGFVLGAFTPACSGRAGFSNWNADGETADPARPRQVLLTTAVRFR